MPPSNNSWLSLVLLLYKTLSTSSHFIYYDIVLQFLDIFLIFLDPFTLRLIRRGKRKTKSQKENCPEETSYYAILPSLTNLCVDACLFLVSLSTLFTHHYKTFLPPCPFLFKDLPCSQPKGLFKNPRTFTFTFGFFFFFSFFFQPPPNDDPIWCTNFAAVINLVQPMKMQICVQQTIFVAFVVINSFFS